MSASPPWPQNSCPDPALLSDYRVGQVSDDLASRLSDHLASCAPCQVVLGGLTTGAAAPVLTPADRPASSARVDAATVTAGFELVSGPDPLVGRMVGPYELLARLGQGGMGVVYRARQAALGRDVALKVLAGTHLSSDQGRPRFFTECAALARLDHPGIVTIHECGDHEGLPYLTMELLGRGSLQRRLGESGPLSPTDAAALVGRLAEAVEAAHRAGVVHRDIKPGNVLLGDDGTPKLADFGLARLQTTDADATNLTATGRGLGTPAYMAPEQARDAKRAGPAADVYSLGAVLYECLTGRPPFQGGARAAVLEQVQAARPEPPSRHRAGVPASLDEVCLRCLEKRPGARYPSAQALADDLGRFLAGEKPHTMPTRGQRVGRWLRRRALPLAVVLGLVISGGGGAAWFALADRRPPEVRALAALEGELDAGRDVTLVGAQGGPKVSRWVFGGEDGTVAVGNDGTVTLTNSREGLLELLPDPRTGEFRLSAEVRHDRGDLVSGAGLYVGQRSYPDQVALTHSFVAGEFNDIGALPHLPRGPGMKQTAAWLKPVVHSDNPRRTGGMGAWRAFLLKPAGEGNTAYHQLEVTVGPAGVTYTWDGNPVTTAVAKLDRALGRWATSPAVADTPTLQGVHPAFAPRGGVGLYIVGGAASFRNVTLTPAAQPAD